MKMCPGFPYPSPCSNPPQQEELWCLSCNRLRMDHLSEQFREIEKTIVEKDINDD